MKVEKDKKKEKTPKKTKDKIDNIGDKRYNLSADNQPSSESKKAGWERRRQSLKMLDKLLEFSDMNATDFMEMVKEDQERLKEMLKTNMTAGELALSNYFLGVIKGKHIVDWLDRHVSKAPTQQEISGPDQGPINTGPPPEVLEVLRKNGFNV